MLVWSRPTSANSTDHIIKKNKCSIVLKWDESKHKQVFSLLFLLYFSKGTHYIVCNAQPGVCGTFQQSLRALVKVHQFYAQKCLPKRHAVFLCFNCLHSYLVLSANIHFPLEAVVLILSQVLTFQLLHWMATFRSFCLPQTIHVRMSAKLFNWLFEISIRGKTQNGSIQSSIDMVSTLPIPIFLIYRDWTTTYPILQ